ncbi:MAG: hypothetical protein EOO09_00715 [Chitinophagaceae bacterium]|nr:MAG: hypothetical protein EOO09_00715 [Chitinophagaceae bacterium]
MERKKFIRDSGIVVFGISAFGNLGWSEDHFVGDSPTTTDILGPFYRPGAPFRTDLNPNGFSGEVLNLFGTLYKEDGKTPVNNALIETWQCQEDGLYDNTSDNFIYRASQLTNKKGKYSFTTTLPVPEPVDEKLSIFRPAHIHLRISSAGHQDLVTQIYFQGDLHLATDPSTKSELAATRILTVKRTDVRKSEIRFDIILKNERLADEAVFRGVEGIYKMDNGSLMEFYRSGDLLFYKTNGQIWGAMAYNGDNTFGGPENDTEAKFQLSSDGNARTWFRFSRRKETISEGVKILHYNEEKP